MHPDNHSLIYAANMMGGTRKNNKSYGWIKRKLSKLRKGTKHSKETRRKMSIAGGHRRGIITSEETKAKMSAAKLGKKNSAEARKNLSIARTGVPWTPAQRAARGIFTYTIDGTTWDSIAKCAKHYGVSEPTIYAWRLKGYTESLPQRDFTVIYDGVEYPSTAAAARAHGITKQGMAQRLKKLSRL